MPIAVAWFGPALATGNVLVVVMVTVDGALLSVPLLTINCATYVPGLSTPNVIVGFVGFGSKAVLPAGRVISDQV